MKEMMKFMISSYIVVRHKEEETQVDKNTVVNKGGWTEKSRLGGWTEESNEGMD